MPQVVVNNKRMKLSKRAKISIEHLFEDIERRYDLPPNGLASSYLKESEVAFERPRCRHISFKTGRPCSGGAKHDGFCWAHKGLGPKYDLIEALFRQRFEDEYEAHCRDIDMEQLCIASQSRPDAHA